MSLDFSGTITLGEGLCPSTKLEFKDWDPIVRIPEELEEIFVPSFRNEQQEPEDTDQHSNVVALPTNVSLSVVRQLTALR